MTVSNTTTQNDRKSERGNVLFLILIAVALFAALSYAVTQSTRSGGGDASKETNLVNAAGITQYPASIKTAITRMVISNSVDVNTLLFDTPSTFDDIDGTTDADLALQARSVFWPTGGGATYVEAPASVMQNNINPGTWHFNTLNQVINIGTTGTSTDTTNAETIAFLPDVKKAVCDSIHTKLGFPTPLVYLTQSSVDYTEDQIQSVTPSTPSGIIGGTQAAPNALAGQPQGCFLDSGGKYIYYHVVAER